MNAADRANEEVDVTPYGGPPEFQDAPSKQTSDGKQDDDA